VALVLAMVSLAAAVQGAERLSLRARPGFAFAPADVHLEFQIAPDARNRALEVTAESFEFYRSSVIELEGERAQRLVTVRYPGLPAGDYSVRGALLDARGRERASVERQITIMTTGGEH